jgi:hypothetical protein
VRRRIKATASPAMIVACIAVVLAMTGSAFAARALITGADIQNGTISRADLSASAARALRGKRGKRGPAGPAGRDGFVGPQGPQGSTGPQGDRGPAGPAGPAGPKGTTGDTGLRGPVGPRGDQGDVGPQGPQGDPGTPGQAMVDNRGFTPTDAGATLSLSDPFTGSTDGVDLTGGGMFLGTPGVQYKVDVFVSFVDPNPADSGAEYGVARLFLGDTPMDGSNTTPNGGGSTSDTLLVTSDVPDDGTNAAQASGSFLINAADEGGFGGILTLRAGVRSGEPDGANVSGDVIVTRIG